MSALTNQMTHTIHLISWSNLLDNFADCPNLKQPAQVESMQENASSSLKKYTEKTHPNQPTRLAKLLLRLPASKAVRRELVEELFFAPLIGTVRIKTIMVNILTNSYMV